MEYNHPKYTLFHLKEGRYESSANGFQSSGAISLLKGQHSILIGTGSPHEKQLLLQGLRSHEVPPEKIEYVVCPIGHPDYAGNLNLFPKAVHIIGYEIKKEHESILHDFMEDIPYEIDDFVQVIPTPGMRPSTVSVIASQTQFGVVGIAYGCFHKEGDLEEPDVWEEHSWDPDTQQQSRIDMLKMTDHIVPRYGNLYRVPDQYKGSQMSVVMTP